MRKTAEFDPAKQVLEIENLVQQHSGKRYTRAVTLID